MSYSCVDCGATMPDGNFQQCSECVLGDLYDDLDNASLSGSDDTDDDSNSSANFCFKCFVSIDHNSDLCEDCSKRWFYPKKCTTCRVYLLIDGKTLCESCHSKEQPTPHIPYIELPYKNCLNCGTSLENLDYSTTRCCYPCEKDQKQ